MPLDGHLPSSPSRSPRQPLYSPLKDFPGRLPVQGTCETLSYNVFGLNKQESQFSGKNWEGVYMLVWGEVSMLESPPACLQWWLCATCRALQPLHSVVLWGTLLCCGCVVGAAVPHKQVHTEYLSQDTSAFCPTQRGCVL